MNNVKESIGWASYTWNPVTGCQRGCEYCYARRIHNRFSPGVPFETIQFHEERLCARMPRKPSRIFVGSMSDLDYWPVPWTKKVLRVCYDNPQHTYMFLSKNPLAYSGLPTPRNTMQGLTLTCAQTQHCQKESVAQMADYNRPFLSIEPLLGVFHGVPRIHALEQVIVGAMTGPGAVAPKPEWIQSIKDNVAAEKIYWKKNIQRYLDER